MKKCFSLLVCSLLLAGCGSMNPNNHSLIMLQHPETKEVVKCEADPWATWDIYKANRVCAEGYEKAGYVRLAAH